MALIVSKDHVSPEIFSLEKLRKQCRFDDPTVVHEEDDLLQDYLDSAISEAENYISSDINEKKYKITGKSFEDVLSFSKQILRSVDVFTYKDENGDNQEVGVDNFYLETVDSFETKICFKEDYTLPDVEKYSPTAVTLEVTTGYASGKVPKDIKKALLLMVTHSYEHRNDTIKEKATKAEVILHSYRKY